MPGALDGLRVLEIGEQIAAPYCGKLLCDLGADVVKLERPPDGDPMRAYGPFPPGKTEPAGLFEYLNAGKRSVAWEPGAERALASWADVVLESTATDVQAPVVVHITPYGMTGPYADLPATGLTLQAGAGWITSRGIPGREPVMVGGRLHDYAAGAYAAAAALTGWMAHRRSGEPVVVDLSIFELIVQLMAYPMLLYESRTQQGQSAPRGVRTGQGSTPGIMRCKDGLVGINVLTGQQWEDVCSLMEVPEFSGRQYNLGEDRALFYERIQPWLDRHTVDEVLEQGQAYRIPVAPVADARTVRELAQLVARDFFVQAPAGGYVQPGAPYRLSRTPARLKGAAPRLAQDAVAGFTARAPSRARDGAAKPLEGVRILDLSTFWSGPIATSFLASMGADVVKVESIQRPDGFRFSGAVPSMGDRWYERSPIWQAVNLSKRGVALDLGSQRGRELVRTILRTADVMIENFSPRVVENFGLDYESVRRLKPDIVMVRMPGYGLSGPWRDYVGWAMAFEQASGMAAATGFPEGPPLVAGGAADPIAGMHTVTAILAALEHRRRTGEGQLIEVAQVEVAVATAAEQVIEHSLTGSFAGRTGNRERGVIQGVYSCEGDDEWVAISVRDAKDWQALGSAMSCAADMSQAALDELAGAWVSTRTPREVVRMLRKAGVPVARLLHASDFYEEPHLLARDFFQEIHHPVTGRRRYPVWPMRFSFIAGQPHTRTAPTLGQHTAEVLGLDEPAMAALAREQVTGDRALYV